MSLLKKIGVGVVGGGGCRKLMEVLRKVGVWRRDSRRVKGDLN
jgi:hypothetical protein